MAIYNINISHTFRDEVFVQTNFITKHRNELTLKEETKIRNMASCQYLKMTEEDAKELAKCLSSICEVIFEDKDNHCTVFMDEKIIEEYNNE